MAKFSYIWEQLEQAGGPLPFLLIDSAGLPGGEEQIPNDLLSDVECLFTGDLAEELADVGPYLGRLASLDGTTRDRVSNLMESSVAILVRLPPATPELPAISFSHIHRHFRKFNMVYGPLGTPLFFRYYDPRVMVSVLSVLGANQLVEFYGVISDFIISGPDKNVVTCSIQGESLVITR